MRGFASRVRKLEAAVGPIDTEAHPDCVADESALRGVDLNASAESLPEHLRKAQWRRCLRKDLVLSAKEDEREVRGLDNRELQQKWWWHPKLVHRRVRHVVNQSRIELCSRALKVANLLVRQFDEKPDLGPCPAELMQLVQAGRQHHAQSDSDVH